MDKKSANLNLRHRNTMTQTEYPSLRGSESGAGQDLARTLAVADA